MGLKQLTASIDSFFKEFNATNKKLITLSLV
jgi:hypothetical protein